MMREFVQLKSVANTVGLMRWMFWKSGFELSGLTILN